MWPVLDCGLACKAIVDDQLGAFMTILSECPKNTQLPGEPWAFKVQVLGRFTLLKTNAPISFSGRVQRKPIELLQLLIASGGTEVAAGRVIDALWPDSDGDAGYHALESTLYRLRRLLGQADAVRLAAGRLSLDRGRFWVDMWELERELHGSRDPDRDPRFRLERVGALYGGQFLEQEGDDKSWVLMTRQRLRDGLLRCIREGARSCANRGLWSDAARAYQIGLEVDLLAEDLYQGLMYCHQGLGERTEALHFYRRCREVLMRFLGVPPSAQTEAIHRSLLQHTAPPLSRGCAPGTRDGPTNAA